MSLFVRLSVADRKNTDKTYLLIHLILVAIPLILVTIFVPSIWGISLLILLSHSIIDFGKPHVANSFKLNPLVTFLLDQMLHLGIILLLAPLAKGVVLPNILTREVLNIILFIVLITKPTNVFFKIFFQKYQPESSQKMDTILGAGATIGLLERIVCDEYLYHFQSIRLNRTCFYC